MDFAPVISLSRTRSPDRLIIEKVEARHTVDVARAWIDEHNSRIADSGADIRIRYILDNIDNHRGPRLYGCPSALPSGSHFSSAFRIFSSIVLRNSFALSAAEQT